MTGDFSATVSHDLKTYLHRRLLSWYRRHGRPLPWRDHSDPYHILVSEVMLQQTQAARVAEKFPQWLRRFPTVQELAAASQREVLLAWTGMGYNRRALNLRLAARMIRSDFGGVVPDDAADLQRLPGVGRYSAHAILCFAFGRRVAVVDVNIRRIFSRVLQAQGSEGDMLGDRETWDIAAALLPPRAYFNWNQALMDLGATVCTARNPRCGACPLSPRCASAHGMLPAARRIAAVRETPRRIYRGRVVEALRRAKGHRMKIDDIGPLLRDDYDDTLRPWLLDVLESLESDGLLVLRAGKGATTPTSAELAR